uniref:Uncharacterized protein n=1 Tax=Wuchereria bancrofti TaxID=6293 RepID=A0A1I8ERM2_WUCBA
MSYDWMDDYCATGYAILLLVPLVTFIVFFACGYAPSSWIINAEIYPMWARTAFFIYAALTMVAFVFFFIFLSETKGTSLEDLEKTAKLNKKPSTVVSFTPTTCEEMR